MYAEGDDQKKISVARMREQEIDELFHGHGAALVLYARQWCLQPEDAVQEAFIDLSRNVEKLNCVVAWLYATTRRKAQNIARSEARRAKRQQQAASQREPWFQTQDTKAEYESLQSGLEQLEDEERQLVVARVWGELNFQQLAALVDTSAATAHRRYAKALQKLRKLLEANVQDCESVKQPPRDERSVGSERQGWSSFLGGEMA